MHFLREPAPSMFPSERELDPFPQAASLEELLLNMRLDDAVGSGLCGAREDVAVGTLLVVEETAGRTVDSPRDDFARACGA
eukprot:scaffold14363_cov20-Tisochrysis_lutea.AAC.1